MDPPADVAGRAMILKADKILVLRYRFIGDTVLTVPFLRNLRVAFPLARIDLMLEPFSGQVLEGCPYVDRIIPFEIKTIHRYSNQSEQNKLASYMQYRRKIKEVRYDAAFVLKRSVSSALLVWQLESRAASGSPLKDDGFFLLIL